MIFDLRWPSTHFLAQPCILTPVGAGGVVVVGGVSSTVKLGTSVVVPVAAVPSTSVTLNSSAATQRPTSAL